MIKGISLAAAILVLAAVGAGAFVGKSNASGEVVASALPAMSIFATPASAPDEPEVRADMESLLGDRADYSKLRVLGSGLGRDDSRLVAFPADDGAMICFGIVENAGTCFRPHDSNLPASLKGQHFHAIAPWTSRGGEGGTELFGIAFDDVVKMRVQVDGTWLDVPLANNGFYLDLPGVRQELVGIVEATLADGSTQVHDIQGGG